ncbi:hypothetical protein KIL84_022782 [Mauremys mutica]|uniref:Uncharacterized protein n=1 Tax=Mauremys mutica TaxID=74926 RepID=A0A9D4AP32_9SAUR|nr:hypothetical protein KIL84_022782 [Mauremys mutica]
MQGVWVSPRYTQHLLRLGTGQHVAWAGFGPQSPYRIKSKVRSVKAMKNSASEESRSGGRRLLGPPAISWWPECRVLYTQPFRGPCLGPVHQAREVGHGPQLPM